MFLDQVLKGDTHFLFNNTRIVDVTTDTKKLCSLIPVATESSEPAGTSSANRGGDGDGLNIGDGGGTAEETNVGREGRL